MFPYQSEGAALDDVLRLSRGMSYKSALAGLPLGGGKAVIIADPRQKTAALMRAMGRFVDSLGGRYITAEDSGTGVADMREMASQSDHVAGLAEDDEYGGDPSPHTALGVFVGLRRAVEEAYGSSDLQGVRVAVQGAGHVGMHLIRLLKDAGAEVWVADPDAKRCAAAAALGCTVVPTADIFDQAVEVFAPCAMGAVINDETLSRLQAKVIAGAANNQLAEMRHAEQLQQRGMVYAPDYLINAGGIIRIHCQRQSESARTCELKIEGIGRTLGDIFERARQSGDNTARVADRLAEERLLGKPLTDYATAA